MKPTVGRILYYYPHPEDTNLAHNADGQPLAAMVAHVNESGTVNLAVFDANGTGSVAKTNVPLYQPDEPIELGLEHATWMPYQVQVAKAAEEKAVTTVPKPATTFGSATAAQPFVVAANAQPTAQPSSPAPAAPAISK